MLPEQQQRIMGYFIEEAKDHLNTIEQGLLSLQATIEDSEKANEVFRAAHSVKGGAAMLGLESIQKTAHRLEDYFKVLKESPVQVDRALETMFLRVSDGLKDLLEQLEGPFGLTQDKAQEIMADVEPVFDQLANHLKALVKKSGGASDSAIADENNPPNTSADAVQASFKQEVARLLRHMLTAFKQPDNAESRKTIQDICAQLLAIGKQLELTDWCDLIETARIASASLTNDYRALAPVLIKEIKKAQDLVLSGRASEVAVCESMQALLPDDILATELNGLTNTDKALDLEQALADSLSHFNLDAQADSQTTSGLHDSSLSDNDDFNALFGDEPEDEPEESGLATEETDSSDLFDGDLGDLFDAPSGEDLFGAPKDAVESSEAASVNEEISTALVDDALADDAEDWLEANDEEPIGRLSLDLDFDEIPLELSTLNRSTDGEERTDESLDALLATVNVTGPDVGTEELNSLADLFDGDLDELDNTLGGHAFIPEEMQLHPERIDASSEEDLNDLLLAEGTTKGNSTEISDDDEIDDDLFGGTLTDGAFAIPLEGFAIADEDDLSDLDSTDLSVDPWADEDEDTPNLLGDDFDGLSLGIDELAEPELSDLANIDLAVPLEDLALNELGSPDVGLNTLNHRPSPTTHALSPRELDIEFPTLTGVKLREAEEAIDSFFVEEPNDDELAEALIPGEQLADDPWGELPIEATLTGMEGQTDKTTEAQNLETENSETESDDEVLELEWSRDEARADDTEEIDLEVAFLDSESPLSFDVSSVEQAGSDLDEWLDASSDDGKTAAVTAASDSSVDELWNELVSPSESTESETANFDRVDSDSSLLADDGLDSDSLHNDSVDTEADDFTGADLSDGLSDGLFDEADIPTTDSEIEDAAADFELDDFTVDFDSDREETPREDNAQDESAGLDGFDISGDELSDEILADFETAFGSRSSDDASTNSDDASTNIDDPEPIGDLPTLDGSTNVSIHDDDFFTATADEQDALAVEADLDAEDLLDFELPDDDAVQGEVALDNIGNNFFESEDFDLDFDDALEPDSDASLGGFLTEDELNELEDEPPQIEPMLAAVDSAGDNDFGDLDSLLSDGDEDTSETETPTFWGIERPSVETAEDEDFGDLERLLEEGTADGSAPVPARRAPQRTARRSGGGVREQNMRVSIKHLDTLSNLVGELVVSRNTLERDQERLRQFLDNLLFQVQQLNDVGQRMRDLYERSLLESSLMSNRRAHSAKNSPSLTPIKVEDHATGETFDALEMDRFTGFHTLSQEMIELIVRVRESSSDIGYTVESSDQVTRQFRQITTQLQEGLNTARMITFSLAADRLPRAVRDISLKCGKEARLIVEGQDTLIDKMIVEHLYDPLTHLVNNAITHGIEMPAVRKAAGKLPEGSITVRAFYQGNQTVIYVADDGGGIDTELVKRKAVEKKLISQSEADGLSALETYELLFHPGFSTRDQADDFAGRGVGMDVVRTSLAEIRGSVTIDSELGRGTSFTIRLPLTLSISKALSCVSNQARIAFPMDGVEDMLDVPRDRIIKNEQGQDCVRWRDHLLAFQPVTNLLKFNRTLGRGRVYGGSQDDNVLSIIVLRNANTYIAVQVDQVIGEQEIVIKQLEGPVPKPLGIAGATVLGDGRVMPIADVLELIDIAMGRIRRESASMMWAQDAAVLEETPVKNDPTVLIVDDSITVRELLSMSFNKVGYRVEQARDGQEAWDKLRSGLPCDLVFCDIEMPRMDGLELLSRMQKDNHLNRIPIAMLTSRGADRHRQMAVDLGASGYFTKPYLEEALLDAAQRMLNGETLAKGRGG